MAICKLNSDLLRSTSCGYFLPELVDIYLANYDDLSGTPAVSADSANCSTITAITLDTSKTFYHVEPAKGSASFEDTLVVEDNGTKYRHASITFTVSGVYDACKVAALDALSLGRYFIVAKLGDGSFIGLGRLSPLEATVATLAGGGDTNGMQITLEGNVAESPLPLSEGAIATVTGA